MKSNSFFKKPLFGARKDISFLNLRRIEFYIKKLDDYQYTSVSIWWNKSLGIGVKGKPNKIHKYLMVGITIFRFTSWFLFTWVGKTKIKSELFAEDGKETISI